MRLPRCVVHVMRRVGLALAGIAIGFALSALGRMEREEELREAALYCAMVGEWKGSGGERGWPDFRGTFDDECSGAVYALAGGVDPEPVGASRAR